MYENKNKTKRKRCFVLTYLSHVLVRAEVGAVNLDGRTDWSLKRPPGMQAKPNLNTEPGHPLHIHDAHDTGHRTYRHARAERERETLCVSESGE